MMEKIFYFQKMLMANWFSSRSWQSNISEKSQPRRVKMIESIIEFILVLSPMAFIYFNDSASSSFPMVYAFMITYQSISFYRATDNQLFATLPFKSSFVVFNYLLLYIILSFISALIVPALASIFFFFDSFAITSGIILGNKTVSLSQISGLSILGDSVKDGLYYFLILGIYYIIVQTLLYIKNKLLKYAGMILCVSAFIGLTIFIKSKLPAPDPSVYHYGILQFLLDKYTPLEFYGALFLIYIVVLFSCYFISKKLYRAI